MIQQILTSPRPQGAANAAPAAGQQIGAGIAGVASTSESPSIMVYHDRSKYNEWEFIFDLTKQKPTVNPASGVVGTPAQNLGTPAQSLGTPAQNFGTPAAAASVGPGQSPNPQQGFAAPGLTLAQGATGGSNPAPGTTPGQNPAAQQASPIPPDIRLGQP